jgi:putative transposase
LIVRYDKRDATQVWVFDEDADRYWPIGLRDPLPGRVTVWEYEQARQDLKAQGYREADQRLIYDTILECRALVAEGTLKTKQARRGVQCTLDAFRALDLIPAPDPALPPPLLLPPPTPPQDTAERAEPPSADAGEEQNPQESKRRYPAPADLAREVEEW